MTMPAEFQYDVFLSHSAKDKAVVRPLTEVAAARQSAADDSAGQVQEEEDGGALPRRRYGKI